MEIRDPALLKALATSHGRNHRQITAAVWPNAKPGTHSQVDRIMTGKIKTITPERAARWAAYFGVPIDTLFVPRSSSNPGRHVPKRRGPRKATQQGRRVA